MFAVVNPPLHTSNERSGSHKRLARSRRDRCLPAVVLRSASGTMQPLVSTSPRPRWRPRQARCAGHFLPINHAHRTRGVSAEGRLRIFKRGWIFLRYFLPHHHRDMNPDRHTGQNWYPSALTLGKWPPDDAAKYITGTIEGTSP